MARDQTVSHPSLIITMHRGYGLMGQQRCYSKQSLLFVHLYFSPTAVFIKNYPKVSKRAWHINPEFKYPRCKFQPNQYTHIDKTSTPTYRILQFTTEYYSTLI